MTTKSVINIEFHIADKDLLIDLLDKFCTLNHLGEKIMSKISEFVAKQKEYNDQMSASLSGLSEDIQSLDDKIKELQASPGELSPQDQAALDEISAASKDLADKFAALDAMNPPVVPPV